MAFTHVHALETFLTLAEEYKDDPRVSFAAFDSKTGKPNWFKTLDELEALRYVSKDKTANQAIKELEARAREGLKNELEEARQTKANYASRTREENGSDSANNGRPAGDRTSGDGSAPISKADDDKHEEYQVYKKMTHAISA